MNTQNLFLFLSVFVVLSGCSTLSETDCLATDWQQVGFEDGNKGIAASSDNSYLQSCSKYDVEMDMNAYNQGHKKGVALFCQTDNGFELGSQNYQYSVDCSSAFNVEYNIGYQFYVANANISEVEKALYDSDTNINKLQSSIANANLRLSDDDISISEETQLRQNIDSMTGQIAGYESNKDRLDPALRQLRQHLESLKRQYNR